MEKKLEPYIVDPKTIDRTYSRCDWVNSCKIIKENPIKEYAILDVCENCKDNNAK